MNPIMRSKTKIVATIGPACDSKVKLKEMLKAGVDCFRFNMKHGQLSWHEQKMTLVRQAAKEVNRSVAILMDLQGPEIRTGILKEKFITLKKGEMVWFTDSQEWADKTQKKAITIDRIEALVAVRPGQKVMVDDGFLSFRVLDTNKKSGVRLVRTRVLEGGELGNRKGVSLPGLILDIPVLMARDFDSLSLKNRQDIDWVALSFVSSAKDINMLRTELKKRKIGAGIIAKIERTQALDNFEEILQSTDGVMVARGDLGVEVPLYEVPFWQKQIIKRCREAGKPVITATEMLQSMIYSPRPTRAEVSDVANAIYDGTDAVMLSAESAMGKYPVKAVEVLNQEAHFSETKVDYPPIKIEKKAMGQTAAIVMAAKSLIECGYQGVCDLSAVVVLTETGTTARYLSRLRPKLPILAVTTNAKVRDQMKLYWGVKPYLFHFKKQSEMSIKEIIKFLKDQKVIKSGQNVVMIYGELWGKPGLTSVVRIQAVV